MLDLQQVNDVLTSINSGEGIYFGISAGIMVAAAGFWGFRQVRALLSDDSDSDYYSDDGSFELTDEDIKNSVEVRRDYS